MLDALRHVAVARQYSLTDDRLAAFATCRSSDKHIFKCRTKGDIWCPVGEISSEKGITVRWFVCRTGFVYINTTTNIYWSSTVVRDLRCICTTVLHPETHNGDLSSIPAAAAATHAHNIFLVVDRKTAPRVHLISRFRNVDAAAAAAAAVLIHADACLDNSVVTRRVSCAMVLRWSCRGLGRCD